MPDVGNHLELLTSVEDDNYLLFFTFENVYKVVCMGMKKR